MNKQIKYILSLMLMVSLGSCTKNFDELNTDPASLTEAGKREMPFMFSRAQSAAAINQSYYQTVQNLYADLYAQYFALSTTSFQTDRYVINDGWLPRPGIIAYVQVVPQLRSIFENTDSTSGEYALAEIMWVYAFHHLTDYFGPVAYFDAGKAQDAIAYDPQDKIYDDFFKRLDHAVKNLKQGPATNIFGTYDLIYKGDVQQWIRFANTLRLRLALRVSKVDPARAKQEAEAAVTGGVMTEISHSARMEKSLEGGDGNGLARVASYNEFSMSSTMASYLKGYNDPRMEIFFQPAVASGAFRGVRNGSSPAAINKPLNQPAETSNAGEYWAIWNSDGKSWLPQLEAPKHVMLAAEAWFLRAEGAMNGWNMGGTAQSLYEKGIETSMLDWGIKDQAIINAYTQSTAVPVAPDDVENSPAVANIPVKFGTAAAIQRQQIGTQKWLAIYPDGMEGWAEYRRSGYPVMYPVAQSNNSDLPAGTFIKRLPYPTAEATTNAVELKKGIALLGGPDNAATRLWWDVE
ncbi:SusD/RagB family nutrient-binding outer membrane lipoprotein [Chitinophaga sp. MM2321]|uniref:SusD/RagB family nutrient-binding outer membrane lipoprotein n=1 Tax=Chitinophaga sp. MM2321 TaxID=3137178 RepID=UPI0032D589BE